MYTIEDDICNVYHVLQWKVFISAKSIYDTCFFSSRGCVIENNSTVKEQTVLYGIILCNSLWHTLKEINVVQYIVAVWVWTNYNIQRRHFREIVRKYNGGIVNYEYCAILLMSSIGTLHNKLTFFYNKLLRSI